MEVKRLDPSPKLYLRARPEVSQQPLRIVSVLKRQPGGAQSRLVRCGDSKIYVLKMHPNPQGPNVLANEAIGHLLLSGLGLCVPEWRPIIIDLKTLRIFPELAMESNVGLTRPSCGVHFGSEFLGGPNRVLFDFIPKSYRHKLTSTTQFLAMFLFDVWASHQDERQCIYRRNQEGGTYDAFFIDNGHLFGGPSWALPHRQSRGACSLNLEVPTFADPLVEPWLKLFERDIPRLLCQAISMVPKYWYEGDIHILYTQLMRRLEFLRTLVAQETASA